MIYLKKNWMNIKETNDENINTEIIFKEYENYGITSFVLEKITSISNIYKNILSCLYFTPNEEEKEKLSTICDYYIEENLINKIYTVKRNFYNIV